MTDPTTDPVATVARAFAEAPRPEITDARASIDAESLAMAEAAMRILTGLGAAMPDEAKTLRARVDELETTVSILEDSEPFSYDDCRDDCDGCHETAPMCDCHVTGAEARARIRDLRDRVEHAEERL